MEPAVLALVLFAAVLHAGWNALLKVNGDRLAAMALISVSSGLICLPILGLLPAPAPASCLYLALSVALHLGYQLFLVQAYRRGDLGQAYPIARGTAPLIVTGLAYVFADETLTAQQLAAIAVMVAGIGSLAFAGGGTLRHNGHSLRFALGTSVFIAGYTVSDGIGARQAGAAHSYVIWLFALNGAPMLLVALAVRRRELATAIRCGWRLGLIGGVMSLAAYWLVIWALTLGPMGPVAALRETSVLFAALIGTLFLGERGGRARILSAGLVAGGLILLHA